MVRTEVISALSNTDPDGQLGAASLVGIKEFGEPELIM